jgi:hypothetical protein
LRRTKEEENLASKTRSREKKKPPPTEKPKSERIENMEYLIRLAQMHETFRRPELEALAVLHNVDLEILEYSDEV